MKSIHTPHDNFVKAVVKNLPVSQDLIKSSLPAPVIASLDLSKLELTSESHIDEKLKPFMSDIIFTCPYKDDPNSKKHAKIPILIEHQSSPDELIAFRVYHYLLNFLYSEFKRTKAKKLSAAYAVVIYHGEQTPYPYSTDFIDCFDDPHQVMRHFLENPVKLIDIGQIPDEQLQKQKLIGIMQGALKYSRAEKPERHIIRLLEQLVTLDFNSERELQLTVRLITNYMFAAASSIDVEQVIKAGIKLPKPVRGEYMTIAEQLEARGVEKNSKLIATNLFKLNLTNDAIAQATGLTLEQVIELRSQNSGK